MDKTNLDPVKHSEYTSYCRQRPIQPTELGIWELFDSE